MRGGPGDSPAKEVLLLFPPMQECMYGDGWKLSENPTAPLGLMYLATPLVRAGYHVNFIDLSVDKLEKEEYFDAFRKTDFVLISCYTHALPNVKIIIKDIKNTNENAYVICGGPYCNDTENHIDGSDMTVFGEADLAIVDIVNSVASRRPLDGIPGLSYVANGSLTRNPGSLTVEDLDSIHPPSLHLAKNKNYGYLYGMRINGMAPVLTSRGCPYRCAFCTFQNVRYRERSIDKVIQEIRWSVEEGAEYILFYDDNLLLKKKRLVELMDRIIGAKFDVKIIIQGRVDSADYDLYKKLKKAGVIIMMFGIESANQDVLDFYNKKTTVERIQKAISVANKLRIITFGNLIIGAPMEERRHFAANKKFLNEVPLDFISIHILKYLYGSPLWVEARKKGLLDENDIMITANRNLSNFTTEELVKVKNELTKSFYNNPRRVLRIMYKILSSLGVAFIFALLRAYFRKTIYNPPTKFVEYRDAGSKNIRA